MPAKNSVELFFADLGPGLVTGCADDDPSGISTYSMAGATFGYGLLWTALISFPMMVSIQIMCGRLGMVTGRGLSGVVRRRYSKWVLWGACSLLIVANVANIAADLGGMADATRMVTGVSALFWTPVYTAVIIGFLFWSSYRQIARIFKWITLVLLAYVATAFFAHVDWRQALLATVHPQLAWSRDYLAVLWASSARRSLPTSSTGKRPRRWRKNALREKLSRSGRARRMTISGGCASM